MSSKKPTLHIHAGLPKTASTYIQLNLANNRDKLLEQGFCYPGEKHSHLVAGFSATQLLDILAKSDKYSCQNIILSSESAIFSQGFYHIPKKEFSACLSYCYIKLLPSILEGAVATNMLYRAEPQFRTMIWNNCEVLWPFSSKPFIDFFSHYGYKNCKIYSYEKIVKKGIWEHFANELGISIENFIPQENVNVTPPTTFQYFLAHLKCLPIEAYRYNKIIGLFFNPSNYILDCYKQYPQRYLLIPKAQHIAMLDEHKEDLEFFADLLNDPTWPQQCYDWLEDKEDCPYDNLPIDLQHEIFALLPPEYQEWIYEAWPKARTAKEDEPLFPNFPTDKDTQDIIEGFVRLETRHSETIDSLNVQVANLQQKLSQTQSILSQAQEQLIREKANLSRHRLSLGPLHPSLSMRFLTGKPPLWVRRAIRHLNHPDPHTTEEIQSILATMYANQKSLAYLSRRAFWKKLLRKLHMIK